MLVVRTEKCDPCRTRLGHIAELGNPLKYLKGRGGEGVSVG